MSFWWRRVWQSLLSTEVWLWINPLGFCPLRMLGIRPEVTHDAQALSTLLAEILDFTDDDGRLMNKSQWLAHIRNGVDHYDQLSSSGMSVHLYGNVAVATGMYQYKITEKGKGVMRSGRFTDVWIQQNAKWKCVASQATLISH